MFRLPRALFPYIRIAAPLAAALSHARPSAAPWLLALAASVACIAALPIKKIVANAQRGEPIGASLSAAALALAALAAALGFAGFHASKAASDVAFPVLLVGLLALLSSLVHLDAPSVLEVLSHAVPTVAERALLDDRSFHQAAARERLQGDLNARAEGAVIGAGVLMVIEAGVSLFSAAAFLVVALGGGVPEAWAWQGAGAFALALASSTAGLARMGQREDGEPLTSMGAALLIPFLLCAVAASQQWNVVLVGAPMVLLGMLLVAARPARYPRMVDVVLTLATLATAVAVARSFSSFQAG